MPSEATFFAVEPRDQYFKAFAPCPAWKNADPFTPRPPQKTSRGKQADAPLRMMLGVNYPG
jgi:hypothetical protein